MNGPPRKQVLEQLDVLQREIAEYHRWLAEFPAVCRVLENLMLRIERPLSGSEQTHYRSVSRLRDEMRAAGLQEGFRSVGTVNCHISGELDLAIGTELFIRANGVIPHSSR